MNTIGKVMGAPHKIQEPARKLTSAGAASNGTQQRTPPPTRTHLGNSKPRSTNYAPRATSSQKIWVKKDPENSRPADQTQSVIKKESTNSGASNQTQRVVKSRQNPSPEASSSKSVAVENSAGQEKGYMRTTQSFSAKEKGKAKVGETGDSEAVKRRKQEDRDRPKHHIQFDFSHLEDGDDDEDMEEEDGIGMCIICEKDLSCSPGQDESNDDEDEYGYYMENNKMPEVGVLGCGHCYHSECLDSITPDDLLSDPPCLICLS